MLDALGCALGALDAPPVAAIRAQLEEFGGRPLCTLIGGGATAPDRACALQRRTRPLSRLQRLLLRARRDLPSERQPRACARGGRVRGRLRTGAADRARRRLPGAVPALGRGARAREGIRPHDAGRVRRRGRRREGACASARRETANAVAIAGTALNALRVTRTGALSQWKGLAYPFTAFGAVEAAFLAARGITGPRRGVRGEQGLHGLDRRPRSRSTGSAKTSSASAAPSSSATTPRSTRSRRSRRCSSCARRIRSTRRTVERIELETFQVAYDIIGGGEEGAKKADPHEGAGRPLAALPACGRAARRAGDARAVRTRADRRARRAGAAPARRCAARRRPVGTLPRPSTPAGCAFTSPAARRSRRRSPTTTGS